MHQFTLLCLLSCAEIFGDFALEKYAHTQNLYALTGGIFGYIGVIYFLIASLRNSSILYVNAAWDGISSLLETLAAMVFLGERLEEPIQYVGIAFITLGLFFMKVFKQKRDIKT